MSVTYLFYRSQKYNTETLNEALSLQEKMAADMGGTEILKPLQYIYKKKPIKGYSRQIFLFTDGAVSNTQNVVKLIRENASSTRVFTFGIGDGCSTELIRQGASVSQGAATFVKDTERLQTKVMSVLKKSMTKPITDLSVKFDLPSEVQHTMVPADLPCLFQGDKLLLYTVLNGDTKVFMYFAYLLILFVGTI
ncbi:hypothetical protein FSP39_000253 [Pinctada imbricata]|uniref:VWFA domain-containing protein n=1 Tax=Pinctada imbricata TaxID=66713 RepID=A0AA88XKB3_PINIB|nr:hypothetical protein FSP39_000253 [Pinctada imbricata]